jgi:hypothetical protein
MDVNQAIKFAQLVNAAYAILPGNLTNSQGSVITAGGTTYTVVTTVYSNDLATQTNPQRAQQVVSIGLVLQAQGVQDVVIAIRGTEGILEWLQDARFSQIPCPFLASAGNTEDGFTDMYSSFRVGSTASATRLIDALPTLPFPVAVGPATPVVICGHSLGAALATLLVLDVAANSQFKTPTAYTYASPRVGDSTFVTTYDHMVPDTYRIANRLDIVPKLPLPPLYDHVLGLYEINGGNAIKLTLPCEHVLNSYLHLLSMASGGGLIPLEAACTP